MFENIESAKRTFWVLVFGFILSVFIILCNNLFKAEVPHFATVLEDATINITLNQKVNEDKFMVCFNDSCHTPSTDKFKNIYYVRYTPKEFSDDFYSQPLKKISIVQKNKTDILDSIDEIYLYVGHNQFYYDKNKIAKFDKKQFNIKSNDSGNVDKCHAVIIPNEYKSNYKGLLNHLCTLFLFIFYGWKKFILSYLMLFGAICIYYKEKLNYKFYKIFLIAIVVIGALLRLNLLNYYPLWLDEVYTKTVAIKSFLSCFKDAGNPPLFFIIEYLASKIFGNYDIVLRFVPFIFGSLLIPAMYLLFRKIDKNIALFASFMVSINTICIYHSQEIRSSCLCMLFTVIEIYLLFEYLKNRDIKNLTLYTLSAICAINTHYYLAIFVFTNYIYGLFKLNKQDKIKFTMCNFVAFLTFLPYLIISFNKAMSASFNSWIGAFNHYKFIYAINEFFLNKYLFLIFVIIVALCIMLCFSKKIEINKDEKDLFLYTIYSILSILAVISIISLLIKPIFHKRLCISLYSLFLILQILIISFSLNIKSYILKITVYFILFTWFIAITHPMPLKQLCNLHNYANFILQDSNKYINNGYEIHIILTDNPKYLSYYPQLLNKKIVFHIQNINSGEIITSIDKNNFTDAKKAVIYLNSIGVEFKDAVAPYENGHIVHTNSSTNAKLVFD